MPRGDKTAYTAKQKRQAKHIVESEVDRGILKKKPNELHGLPSINKMVAVRKSPINILK